MTPHVKILIPGLLLSPCPFCLSPPTMRRGPAVIPKPGSRYYILCENEDCPISSESRYFPTAEAAADAWNHRWYPGYIRPAGPPEAARETMFRQYPNISLKEMEQRVWGEAP